MKTEVKRKVRRRKRHLRARTRVVGTPERPRLSVRCSSKHVHAQIIDDWAGTTLAAASTVESDIASQCENTSNVAAAATLGQIIGERSVAAGIKQVVFDRGGRDYHGRIKALAEAAREAGLDF